VCAISLLAFKNPYLVRLVNLCFELLHGQLKGFGSLPTIHEICHQPGLMPKDRRDSDASVHDDDAKDDA